MKINLAKSAGFCFGVKRALSIASEIAKLDMRIEMLGDIVHNEDVVRGIYKSGIKKVKILHKGKNKILLIRTHGTAKNVTRRARALNYKVVDATCPMVKEIHKIATEMEQKGYRIIIIGDRRHDEVHGIAGQLKTKAIVLDSPVHIPLKMIQKIKKACIVVQSTQNLDNVLKIFNAIKPHIKNLKFFNTICAPTKIKQSEIKTLPKENDVVIIIGSKTSANTKRLYEISKSINRRTYWIQSKREVKSAWFKDTKRVGVTSGASTPDTATQEIIAYIKQKKDLS